MVAPKRKKRKGSRSKAALEARQLDVARMKMKGLSHAVIASMLDPPVSVETVAADLRKVRARHGDIFRKRDPDELWAEFEFKFLEIEAKAWDTYEQSDVGSGNRVKALTELRNIQSDRIKLLKAAGVVSEQAKRVEVEVTHLATLKGFSDDEIDALQDGLIMQKLTTGGTVVPAGLLNRPVLDAELVEEGSPSQSASAVASVTPVPPKVPRTAKVRN